MLIECSSCHAVFSLQDGVAPAGARFKARCGRCHAVFEAISAPKSGPAPALGAATDAAAPAREAPGNEEGADAAAATGSPPEPPADAAEKDEWTPEPAETVVRPLQLVAPGPPAGQEGDHSAAPRWRRRGWLLVAAAALVLAAFAVLREWGHASSVEEKVRRGRELLLRDDNRSLEEETKLFTDAARAAPGQAVPEAERAFALLLQAAAAKDLARRLTPPERDKQEREAARLLQQGAAAALQGLSEDQHEEVALRATALAEALGGKAEEAAAHAEEAERGAPADPWTLYAKAAAAAAGHLQNSAVQALSAAREMQPLLLRADVDLAAISLDGGDTAGARTLLEGVLRRNPKHERARRMLSLIAP